MIPHLYDFTNMKYNEQQKEAIMHLMGPMLVLAGPGCGKTAVITGRIINLINNGVSPSSILVVTFTRAAASEMKERFLLLSKNECRGINFGTFHGIFYRILREEYKLTSENIISEETKFALIKNLVVHYCEDCSFENELTSKVIQEISYIKGNGISSKNFYSSSIASDAFNKIYSEYRRWMKENRRLDFDDITTVTYDLLFKNESILDKWRRQFEYILVDEFQDINRLQYQIIRMLAQPLNNLFVVGDDDQSIYRFRGSDPEIMLSFPKNFDNCRIVSLSDNYRSSGGIINAASRVIKGNKHRYEKVLTAHNHANDDVQIKVFDNIRQEMDRLSIDIREKAKKEVSYKDIAVLVRTNFGARAAIEKLMSDRIPFEAEQEVPCVFDHFIAKDIIAYMKIGNGSDKREDYLRICNKPNRYISRNAFYESRVRFEMLYSFYEDRTWMWKRLEELEENLHALRNMPPYGAIQYIRKVIRYDEYIREYALEHKIPIEDLMEPVEEISESAKEYKSLDMWMEHIENYRESLKNAYKNDKGGNTVKISTLHSCKGKEYDIVYMLDVNDGVIPYHKARLENDIEEERRLFYVGMTRAKNSLNIYAVKERYEKKMDISPFIKGIIEDKNI